MGQGLVLLGLLAALVAVIATRLRRKLGLQVTGKTSLAVMTGFVLIALALWAASQR
jgi:drug/metabolite transporter (DMT)-like permease